MTRVTYKRNEDGTLTNSKRLLAINKFVYVTIYPNNAWQIEEVRDPGNELKFGVGIHLTETKKQVKKALIELGVQFQDEVRTRLPKEMKGDSNA